MNEKKTSSLRERHKKAKQRKRFRYSVKDKIYVWMAALLIVVVALVLHVDEIFWPGWLGERRAAITAVPAVILLISWLISPLLVEVDERPRSLSGPGKNPYLE